VLLLEGQVNTVQDINRCLFGRLTKSVKHSMNKNQILYLFTWPYVAGSIPDAVTEIFH